MADKPSFTPILNKKASETEDPKLLPRGLYTFTVDKQYTIDKSPKKQTEYVRFVLHPIEAGEDVDEDELDSYLSRKDGSKKILRDVGMRLTFYTTEEAVYRLRNFLLRDLKIDNEEDLSYAQLIDEAASGDKMVMAYVKHIPNQSGDGFYAEIDRTAPVED